MAATGCYARTGWAGIAMDRCGGCAISTAGKAAADCKRPGSPANWRCIALEKLSHVELLEDAWRTAPNHLRPQTCVAVADVDAEDQPAALAPQKGQ
jgi:hypothetical protein